MQLTRCYWGDQIKDFMINWLHNWDRENKKCVQNFVDDESSLKVANLEG
jgi:hypothetical protein